LGLTEKQKPLLGEGTHLNNNENGGLRRKGVYKTLTGIAVGEPRGQTRGVAHVGVKFVEKKGNADEKHSNNRARSSVTQKILGQHEE